jgi:hypothetical protein
VTSVPSSKYTVSLRYRVTYRISFDLSKNRGIDSTKSQPA